jgi:hypothetical protein
VQEALDRGARQVPAGQWACLMIKPHLSRVSSHVLRPAEASPDVGALGRVHTHTGTLEPDPCGIRAARCASLPVPRTPRCQQA